MHNPNDTSPQHPSVAIQGEEGSYHDIAARHYFGATYVRHSKDTFDELFADVANGRVAYGLSAVENSLVGSIPSVYDLLRATPEITIIGEIYLCIHHSLIGLPGSHLTDITDVYSHPVALGQCTTFLKQVLPRAVAHAAADTAGSAVYIKDLGKSSVAAIAGGHNAARLGLQILQENIENNPENYTRFLALARTTEVPSMLLQQADKTSLLLNHLGDADDLAPGILYHALSCFAAENITLTKIESRPISAKPWHYVFYLDCLAGIQQPPMERALHTLRASGADWRTLGTYRRGETI